MPHQRSRTLIHVLQKRLKLFSVVGLLGARQTGKSTLLRDILSKKNKIRYITLDREETKARAVQQPTLFLKSLESAEIDTVCIDEVQKAPSLFDTIKAEVDEKKRPGRFCISGSTEFSKKTGVQEALTGRIALLHLYPLNLSEILEKTSQFPLTHLSVLKPHPQHLKKISQWLTNGGMPGFFAIRDQSSRESVYENWLETTCTRDLAQFKIPRFDIDLARRIYLEICRTENSTRHSVAQSLSKSTRQIAKYIDAFKSLFVIYEISPHPKGVGKSILLPFDAGIANFLGASTNTRLQIWFLNELLSQFTYAGLMKPEIYHYETTRGSRVHFVVEGKNLNYAVLLTEQEAPNTYTMRALEAFSKKFKQTRCIALAPCIEQHKYSEKIEIISWSAIT